MSNLVYKELITERLFLRLPKKSDYKAQYEFLSNPENFPYADYKTAKSMEDIQEYFKRMLSSFLEESIYWVISLKDTQEPIGTLSAWNLDLEERTIEFGYAIYPKYRGNGYMTEAILAAIDFIKKENKLFKFDIWTDARNLDSLKIPKRLNFEFTGNVIEKAKHSNQNIIYKTFRLEEEE